MPKGWKKFWPYKKALKIAKRIAKDRLLSRKLPAIYEEAAKQPVDERKVLFAEGKLTAMPDAYTLLWNRLEKRYDFDLSYITLRQNSVRYKEYEQNCEAFVRELATAKYVFLNDASDVVSCVPLRPETKVVQLWHACGAFKKWGMSTADLKFGGSREDILRHPFYKNLSMVTVSSPEVEWAYREAMVLEDTPEVVQPIGVSRTDVFHDPSFVDAARRRVELRYPACKDKQIILYAPTFRGHVKTAKGPGDLDIEALRDALGDTHVLLIKHHPFVKCPPEIPEGCETFAFQVGNRLPIDALLCAADICISDYSSIVFEYSLFERPMAFFAPDLSDYGDWRGFYYDYDELTPGPVFQDNECLIEWLTHLDERFDKAEVSAFRNRFMSSCDGFATRRIIERVFDEETLQLHSKMRRIPALAAKNGAGKDISIIIPAYNASDTLVRALESIIDQTYATESMEVVIVDDCSNDDTFSIAKRYAEENPGLITVAQTETQSGSPSEPRNIGLQLARGEYVFFMDADDWLGDEAVLRMLGHAVEWNSDVLAVKLVGRGGRSVPTAMFASNDPDVDIYRSKLMWTFAPLKLFRKTLVENIRFPRFMPEDISFVLRAFVEADIVSIAADYDYYNAAYVKNDDANISLTTWNDVESNLEAYGDLFEFIEQRVPAEEREHVLLRRIIRRDVFRTLITVLESQDERARDWFDRIIHQVGPHYQPDVYLTTPPEMRIVLDAAFFEGFDVAREVVEKLRTTASEGAEPFLHYAVTDDSLICHVDVDAGTYDCQIERALRSKASIVDAAWNSDGTLSISGSVAASRAVETLVDSCGISIVARDNGSDFECAWDCALSWTGVSPDVVDEYPAKGTWSACLTALEAFEGFGRAQNDKTQFDDEEDGDETRLDSAAAPQEQELAERSLNLYLVMRIGGIRKAARLRYPVISSEYPWGSISFATELEPSHQYLLRGNRAGNFSLVERTLSSQE